MTFLYRASPKVDNKLGSFADLHELVEFDHAAAALELVEKVALQVPHLVRNLPARRPPDVLRRSLKLSPSESHISKIVYQELRPSDGRSRHIAADGRRPCEGAWRCEAFSF